jgi:DNA-binding NtrC family response regulator
MDTHTILLGKRVLIADDEKDILAALIDLLRVCKIDTASSFEEAKDLLERRDYDIAVLDIMGIRGFELLEVARKRGIPALMLTAHALNEESLAKSMEDGAAYFVPKEKMVQIDTYVADVLEAMEKGKNPWVRWFKRLAGTVDVAFTGPKWREQKAEFLKKLKDADW